jgi:hypothetical protein
MQCFSVPLFLYYTSSIYHHVHFYHVYHLIQNLTQDPLVLNFCLMFECLYVARDGD